MKLGSCLLAVAIFWIERLVVESCLHRLLLQLDVGKELVRGRDAFIDFDRGEG